MKFFWLIVLVLISSWGWAQMPEPVVTVGEAHGSFAVVAGKLTSVPGRAVGISVLNGNIISSTVSDAEGRWSVVIRHLSTQFSVSSWELHRPSKKSKQVTFNLMLTD